MRINFIQKGKRITSAIIVLLTASSAIIVGIFTAPKDSVVPSRKDMIRWIGDEHSNVPFSVEEVRAILLEEADYDALVNARSWSRVACDNMKTAKHAVMGKSDNDSFYNVFCGFLRTKIHMLYNGYSSTTNLILNRVSFDDRQLRIYAGRPVLQYPYCASNFVEVKEGIYLSESEMAIYSELTNFLFAVINEELDGITQGRNKVRTKKHKFNNDILNRMVWGETMVNDE